MEITHIVGQTRASGFQVGVRRTFAISPEAAWTLITSPVGLTIWLGAIKAPVNREDDNFTTINGEHGQIKVYEENSHIRLTWQPENWPIHSTIQVRIIPTRDKTTIAFHQENLPGPSEREERHLYFKTCLDKLEEIIKH